MKGVIIAAGDGGRLQPLTNERAKVTLPLWGKPLIAYPLEAMMASGIKDIAVVVGYRAWDVVDEVQSMVPAWANVEFIHNPDYDGGNAISIFSARHWVGGSPFVLSMGDHIIEPQIVATLLEMPYEGPVLAVDSAPALESQVNDATRVLVDRSGVLLRIGKEIAAWNAVDIGVFRFEPSIFGMLCDLKEQHGVRLELNQVMQELVVSETPVQTGDINGLYWNDIDTLEDYRCATGE